MSLRAKLREHRQRLGLSLDELAAKTGSSKSYLWELENRDEKKPSAEKLAAIADVLEVTTDYLLNNKTEMTDEQLKNAFFKKFSKLGDEDQKRIHEMIDLWGKKPK